MEIKLTKCARNSDQFGSNILLLETIPVMIIPFQPR